jgi:tetratricopeptide (TPR) repeat protein
MAGIFRNYFKRKFPDAATPTAAESHYRRANALKDLGQYSAALGGYDDAVRCNPNFTQAWCNRGVVQQALGSFEAALASYDRAIALDPADALAHSNRGSVLQVLRRWAEALAADDCALGLDPRLFQTWFHRGNVLRELQQLDEALASYQKALALRPDHAEANYNSGVLLERTGELRLALASYDAAVTAYPEFYQAHYNRAGILKRLKESEAALRAYERAIAARADYAEAHANRGVVLQELGRLEDALVSYDRALAIRPDSAEGHFNRGSVLKVLRRWDEALASYSRAIELRPAYSAAYCDRAEALMAIGQWDAALTSFDQAVAIQPDFPEAQYNRSLAQLLTGDYANGWANYEWRWRNADRLSLTEKRSFDKPLWSGRESLAGKTLLVYNEQGFGDTLQFCRFVKPVADRGADVILEVQAPLASLCSSLEGVARTVVEGQPVPEIDFRCPLLSLPLALNTTLDTIPAATGYLRCAADKVALWRARLGPRNRARVGLTWSGNPAQGNDHNRSFRLADWIHHLPREFDYVCLQKDVRAPDAATLAANPWISRFDDELLRDFGDTAALCECLDLVVSVCTSVAHLSGALGKPTWVLLPFNPDWRWLLDRSDSPWYSTVTLYRQRAIGDWRDVFGRIAADLRRAFGSPSEAFATLYADATSAAAAEDFPRAIALFERAIEIDPSSAEAYYKRGNVLKNLGQLSAALASYDDAIDRRPGYAHAYCNRGVVQQRLGLGREALTSYDRAIALDPVDAMAHYNRALLMQDSSRWDEVLASYERAVSIDPSFADAQYNRSLTLLFRGDFGAGWRAFEWRWKIAQRLSIGRPRNFTQPLWLGDTSIEGKRLLLYCEGGLGDTLQFCRYARLCAALGARVLLEVQAPLFGLLASLEGVAQLLVEGSALPAFDYRCPLMSLPLAFKTTLDTIPAGPRYLQCGDDKRIARWHTLLGTRNRPRVGLAWSGNANNPVDPRRSFHLADWVNKLPREFQYVCVQKDVRPTDLEPLAANPWISRFDAELQDFSATAALCECLDLVVSVDTSVAHLSGALGRPTWILLPLNPDWRWLSDRDDSPWYPTAKLYRQRSSGDWQGVFDRIAADLRQRFSRQD